MTEKIRGACVVMAVDRRAADLGLTPGMKLADARALVPELAIFDYRPLADAVLLDHLAEACLRYTPMVAAVPPDALLLDITGCTHFYGSDAALAEKALAEKIEELLDGAGYAASWAIAGTPDAALALARHGLHEGAEGRLPVSALGMDDKSHRALERAGLCYIGDLAVRPRAGLAVRFGPELGLRLDRILGAEDRPINPLRLLGNVTTERRFADPVTYVDFITSCLEELFAEAALLLQERGQGARMIRMLLFRCDGAVSRLSIETGAPTRDVALFARLLKERIDTLDDPLNPGFGYDLIRLTIAASEALAAEQYALEEDLERPGNGQGDCAALIGQLSIRLGREQIRRFQPANGHIPEQGLLSLPAIDASAACLPIKQWPPPRAGEPPLRPLHLFDPPQRIKVLAEVPDGPPYHFTWRRKQHQIARYEGPERIASEWWQRKDGQQAGKGGLTRDYYRIEDVRGRRYWVFRHGLYGDERRNPDWYIHGLFA